MMCIYGACKFKRPPTHPAEGALLHFDATTSYSSFLASCAARGAPWDFAWSAFWYWCEELLRLRTAAAGGWIARARGISRFGRAAPVCHVGLCVVANKNVHMASYTLCSAFQDAQLWMQGHILGFVSILTSRNFETNDVYLWRLQIQEATDPPC